MFLLAYGVLSCGGGREGGGGKGGGGSEGMCSYLYTLADRPVKPLWLCFWALPLWYLTLGTLVCCGGVNPFDSITSNLQCI